MTGRVSIIASWLVVLAPLLVFPSQAQFEGVVETKNLTRDETGKPHDFVMTMWIRKDMVKVTSSAIGTSPGSTMIYRNDQGVVWILDDENKTYYSIPLDADGVDENAPRNSLRMGRYSLKRTHRLKRILGYPAEQIIITQGRQRTEVWGTKKLNDLSKALSSTLGESQSGAGNGWSDELTKMGLYPLVSSTIIRGKVAESQEVTKIEVRPLLPELFELPATYRRQGDPALQQLREPPKN